MHERAFKNVIHATAAREPIPVDRHLDEPDAFIDADDPYRINQVVPAIGNGTASIDAVKRSALEHTILTNEMRTHALNRWLTG